MPVSQSAVPRATGPINRLLTNAKTPAPPLPEADWAARLIPGSAKAASSFRKAVRAVSQNEDSSLKSDRVYETGKQTFLQRLFTLVFPPIFTCREICTALPSATADCALVVINWLMIGALTIPLRALLPHVRFFERTTPPPGALLGIALLHAALLVLWGNSEGLYAGGSKLRRQTPMLIRAILYPTALLYAVYRIHGTARSLCLGILAAGVLHFATLSARRWIEQRSKNNQTPQHLRNVLIVGAGEAGREIAAEIELHSEEGRVVCGFLDDQRPLGNGIIGRTGNLAYIARKKFIDEIIVSGLQDRGLMMRLLYDARRLRLDVKMIPDLSGSSSRSPQIDRVGDLPAINLHEEKIPAAGLFLKRAVDIVAAGAGLVALSPFFGMIAVLIKLDSRGPIFYTAERAGLKGRPFRCFKFRTMMANADELKASLRRHNQRSGPFFKVTNDPRITRVGKFLRNYSLDELPQLWNVLHGEMSLVGPRPHPLDDFSAYEVGHLARLDVTPGITGLWQVSARRDPSFQKGMQLDREYIRTWGVGLDLRILFKTMLTVVAGGGE